MTLDTKAIEAELEARYDSNYATEQWRCNVPAHVRNLIARVKELEAERKESTEQYANDICECVEEVLGRLERYLRKSVNLSSAEAKAVVLEFAEGQS